LIDAGDDSTSLTLGPSPRGRGKGIIRADLEVVPSIDELFADASQPR
jgi:hypothetical protein